MPRPKTLPDSEVLKAAYALVHRDGPDALTFATLADACGLSASTLVQRFKSKADLVRSTLAYAWDGLDEKTAAFSAQAPKTPAGAVQLLTMLSKDYGEIEAELEGMARNAAEPLRECFRVTVLAARADLVASDGRVPGLIRPLYRCVRARHAPPPTLDRKSTTGILYKQQANVCS